MNEFDFTERLAFSTQTNGRGFEEIIQQTLPGIIRVQKTSPDVDRTGIDYIATLRRGATVNIDVKLRDKGCSRFWEFQEEEIALETWSVIPTENEPGKVGWTLDESKKTHYTLHAFDQFDSCNVFLLPFQLLRKAFRTNLQEWFKRYKHARQKTNGKWFSECVFVPISIVLDAIRQALRTRQSGEGKVTICQTGEKQLQLLPAAVKRMFPQGGQHETTEFH